MTISRVAEVGVTMLMYPGACRLRTGRKQFYCGSQGKIIRGLDTSGPYLARDWLPQSYGFPAPSSTTARRKPASEIQADLEPGADPGRVAHSGSAALVSRASSWNVGLAADLVSGYLFPSDGIGLIQDENSCRHSCHLQLCSGLSLS